MKILLNGATGGTNFGDFLFARMFQNAVAECVGFENACWYSSRFAYSDFYRKHLNNNNTCKLKDIQGLVYISGGYFCGNDKKLRDYVIRYLSYFAVGLRCLLLKKPYGIFGLEVGKSKNFFINLIQKRLLTKAKIVIVRNQKSYDEAIKYGVKNPILTADTVFAMERGLYADSAENEQVNNCEKKLLFMHIGAYQKKNDRIVEKIVPVVNGFLKNHPEYGVVVATDQDSPEQDQAVKAVAEQLQCDTIILNHYDDPLALCKVIDKVDTVVTTKLHVGIVGALLNKSVISFSGHTEKIHRLYVELGEQDRTIPLADLNTETGIAMIEQFHDKPIVVSEQMKNKARLNMEYLKQFIADISGEGEA